MDNFFKSLKENLENREAPDFNPAAWERMQLKMTDAPITPAPKTPISKWIPLLALLLIGSTALNYWLFSNSNNTNLNSHSNRYSHQIDTIIQTNVIYKTDTIYTTNTIYKTKYVAVETASKTAPIVFTPTINTSVLSAGDINSEFTFHTLINDSKRKFGNRFVSNQHYLNSPTTLSGLPSSSSLKELEEDQLFENSKTKLASLNSIYNNKLVKLQSPIKTLELEPIDVRLTKYKKSFSQMIYPMRPKAFKIGISAGILSAVGKGLETNFNFISGIEPAIIFSENLELFGEVSYFKTNFETERMDESIGIPVIEPENEEATFGGAELSQDILQFGIGMKYLFANKTKFSPYVGVGFYGLKISNYKVEYDFEIEDNNTGGGDNEDEELEIRYDDYVLKNQFVFRTGIEYRFLQNWSVVMDAFYRQNMNQTGLFTPNNLGLKTGIYRKF